MDAAPTMASTVTPTVPLTSDRRVTATRVVLMGPPGAGKGTQAGVIARWMGIAHVASGDLFREVVRRNDELSQRIRSYMDRGALVPDELTVSLVLARLREPDCRHGFVLDGFPRNRRQAERLDAMLERDGIAIDRVVDLQVPKVVLLARLAGRWLCRSCHTSYHARFSPPRVTRVCDRCGDELYQRVDDAEETARRRLELYHAETHPVLEHYRARGILAEVDGDRPMPDVTRALHQVCLSDPDD